MEFDIFKYQRNFPFFFLLIPTTFIIFIVSCIISWILFKNQFPEGWLFIALVVFILLARIQSEIVSYFRFSPNGKMIITDNELIIDSKYENKNYTLGELKSIKIYYAGDKYWKSFINIFSKSRGRSRYVSVFWSKKEDELNSIDKIFINNKEYQIKIRNKEEKERLLKFVYLLEKKKINFKLEGNLS